MKLKQKIISLMLLIVLLVGGLSLASSVDASTRVGGYTTKRGTYVQPYYRSNSNSIKYDNYSSKGNYNPYTGKKGYKKW
jgi:uncharacterized membrane protein YfhO